VIRFFISCVFLVFSIHSFASNVGMVVKKQGKAELLSSPSQTFSGKGKKVLYEGTYYTLKKVRRGTKIKNGNILRTGNGAKLKVVFKNGDQFNIGEGTAYKINWKKNNNLQKRKSNTTVNLIYGSLRGVISKKGPRNTLKVKSKNAVMGVRGTDFSFSQRGTSGKTSISVLRGKVDVSNINTPKKVVNVQQGFSAELKLIKKIKSKAIQPASLKLVRTSKSELLQIQKDSKIEKEQDEVVSKEIIKEIKDLQTKAVSVTMDDIKEYQPQIYQELKKKTITSVDTLNTKVVATAYKKAPIRNSKKDIDETDLEENAYKKYFTE
jgi:hypothetical protein